MNQNGEPTPRVNTKDRRQKVRFRTSARTVLKGNERAQKYLQKKGKKLGSV